MARDSPLSETVEPKSPSPIARVINRLLGARHGDGSAHMVHSGNSDGHHDGRDGGFQNGVHEGSRNGCNDGLPDGAHSGSNDGLCNGEPNGALLYDPFEIRVGPDGTLIDCEPGECPQPGADEHAELYLLWLQDRGLGGERVTRSLLERLYTGPFLANVRLEPHNWRTVAMYLARLSGIKVLQRDQRRGPDRQGSSRRDYYIPRLRTKP
jgi:hypothetical protein